MKIKANETGFYQQRREAGEVFDWPDVEAVPGWAEKIEEESEVSEEKAKPGRKKKMKDGSENAGDDNGSGKD